MMPFVNSTMVREGSLQGSFLYNRMPPLNVIKHELRVASYCNCVAVSDVRGPGPRHESSGQGESEGVQYDLS